MTNNVLNVDFTSKNTFEEKANYSEIVFGMKRPLLTTELNELQSILKNHRTNVIDNIFGSGILGVGTISFSGGTLTVQNEKAIIKGELINITSQNIVLSEGNDVYLTASYVEKTGSDTIKEYGNPQSSVNITNRIEDADYGETSRRKQLVFNLSKVSVPSGLNLKLGRISGGKFIQECDTIANNLASNIVASKLGIKDAENLFDATNVEDALIELMRQIKTVYKTVEGSFISEENTLDSFAKNIEIQGNTIQNPENLSDIKSVGDKVGEQELYKIPITVNGLNLSPYTETGGIDDLGVEKPYSGTVRSGFIKVNKGVPYYWGWQHNATLKPLQSHIFLYDINKVFKKAIKSVDGGTYTPEIDGYMRIYRSDTSITGLVVCPNKPPTKIEEYQEYTLDILSPTPLESIDHFKGKIFDRIIEKDGVWGVEKNVYHINPLTWKYISVEKFSNTNLIRIDGPDTVIKWFSWSTNQIFNNKFDELLVNTGWDNPNNHNKIASIISNNKIDIIVPKDIDTKEQALEYIKGLDVRGWALNPQFIPLPDDQQVRLRTFASETNISFLTEVGGKIKADIPSNLGATVNSNTLAIQDLTKDLARVKRLEEASTSIITTNKKITTIEETTNGYLSGIKLEGKTFVNLITDDTTNAIILNSDKRTSDFTLLKTIPQNTNIRIFINITSRSVGNHPLKINFIDSNNQNHYYELTWGAYNQIIDFKLNHDCKKITIYLAPEAFVANPNAKIHFKELSVVEGVNVNNYFKGMKSVGDDVIDLEIVSMSKDLKEVKRESVESTKVQLPIARFEQNGYVYNPLENEIRLGINKSDAWVRDIIIPKDTLTTFSLNENEYIGNIIGYTVSGHKDVKQLYKVLLMEKCDKKKVLYYDTESQTWKKPILREHDTLENHNDGKYYYHKRAYEFNGATEDLSGLTYDSSQSTDGIKCFWIERNAIKRVTDCEGVVICDKLNTNPNYSTPSIGVSTYTATSTVNPGKNWLYFKLPSEYDSVDKARNFIRTLTVVTLLEQEKIYECMPIDLTSYEGETNYLASSSVVSPKSIIKTQNYIGNIMDTLKGKVDELEDTSAQTLLELISHNHDDLYFKQDLGSVTDFNTATNQGKYYVSSASTLPNSPINAGIYGELLVLTKNANELHQIYFDYRGEMYLRFRSSNNGWHEWVTVYTSAKKPKWNDILEKPSTFTPSTHNHDDRYYTENEADNRFLGKTSKASSASVADKVEWSNVANKPSSFTPSTHNHDDRYIHTTPTRIKSGQDLNKFTTGGNYIIESGVLNSPNVYGRLVVLGWDNSQKWVTQILYSDVSNEIFTRCSTNAEATSWTPWTKLFSDVNKPTWNDVTGKPSSFTPSSHDHDGRYYTEGESDDRFFRNNVGDVTDFNTATTVGRYYVYKENGAIPNAPVNGAIYGSLEVFHNNNSELMQRFTGIDGKIFTRIRNYANKWLSWQRTTTTEEFACMNGKESGYQKLPGGVIIQWGTSLINFTSNKGNGYLNYPIAFTQYCTVTGNVGTNDYGGYAETSGTVQGDSLTRAYAEVINLSGNNVAGKLARINWIAIGI